MPETYTGPERRKYPRAEDQSLIFYETSKSPEVKAFTARNISVGGICFDAMEPVPQGDTLKLVIAEAADDAEATNTMTVQGKVIWTRELAKDKYRVGLLFAEIDESHRATIIEYVERLLKE